LDPVDQAIVDQLDKLAVFNLYTSPGCIRKNEIKQKSDDEDYRDNVEKIILLRAAACRCPVLFSTIRSSILVWIHLF
jgi:hypothetical protein